jgi:hypothetical protein
MRSYRCHHHCPQHRLRRYSRNLASGYRLRLLFSAEKLERLFIILEGANRVSQDDTAGVYDGLGLGLAVVSRIIDQSFGQLRVESEIGIGSRFYIDLLLPIYNALDPGATDVEISPGRSNIAPVPYGRISIPIPCRSTNLG